MRRPLPPSSLAPANRCLRRLAAGAALVALAALAAITAALLLTPAAAAGPAPASAAGARADDDGGGRSAEPRVILYGTSWCPWCRKTRALLEELGVAYADKDIETSPEAAREYREKAGAGAGVPVLDIGGTIVQGYDPEQIRKLVAGLKAEEAEPAR
jgi:glutaredoxin